MKTLSRTQFLRGEWQARRQIYEPSPVYRADIGHRCLAVSQVLCRTCEDSCEPLAISFKPILNGTPQPCVNLDLCDGCGECFRLCPVSAIHMVPYEELEPATPAGDSSSISDLEGSASDLNRH